MTLNQILQFITVCQYCNFTKAAEALHLSQPGVSKSIRELEAECGTALFERHYNNISMTRSGEVLYEKAQRFMEHYRAFEAEAHALSALQSTLHIGVVPMCGNTVFPKLHAAFLKAYPESRIATVEDIASMLYDMLDQHELDFILCVTNHLPDAHYHYHVLKKSRLKLFVAASSPLADRSAGCAPRVVSRPFRPDPLHPAAVSGPEHLPRHSAPDEPGVHDSRVHPLGRGRRLSVRGIRC